MHPVEGLKITKALAPARAGYEFGGGFGELHGGCWRSTKPSLIKAATGELSAVSP